MIRKMLPKSRRAAMLVLIAFCLPLCVIMAAFAVDVAWMQLVRTELRIGARGRHVIHVARHANRFTSTCELDLGFLRNGGVADGRIVHIGHMR